MGYIILFFIISIPLVLLLGEITDSPENREKRRKQREAEKAENARKQAEAQRRLDEIVAKDRAEHKAKCPTCGSERCGPISQAAKVQAFVGDGSIGRGGINNPYFGKSYECYNCGYRW